MSSRHAFALSLAALLLMGRAALAQDATNVEELHRRGLALREEGRPSEALDLFLRAHALRPEPRSLVRMALAEAELGRWVDAHAHLRAAMSAPDDRFIRQHRRDLEEELDGIRGHVGLLEVQSATPGVTVSINGGDAMPLPPAPVTVPEGALNIELAAAGCETVRRSLTIAPRATAQLIVQLVCAPTASTAPTVATAPPAPRRSAEPAPLPTAPSPHVAVTPSRNPQPPRSSSGTLRTLAWVSAGGAALFLGTGVVATALGSDAAAQWNDDSRCLTGTATRGETCAAQADLVDVMRPLAIGGFVAGSLAAAASVALFVGSSGERAPSRAAWACAPSLGAPGLACGATF
jgi:tetratricopeptide (TPR) repeat protein